ncbi:hypothetical protein PC119_g19041 [Phytophthora cactorum]|uniref:Uncharacterized protein n=1 Tax=Phytophthora cactorum TaxID=29920 RepID=A0A8T1BYH6_9STRA|nr:hypothetical protein PC117_g18763 [Phytophthora cactorum]KAG2990840.1 hypothetical protein PC119_g19041 [Phytophthora cactorum]KAG3030065.1 hypothetical protein PC120_g3994 [Phytophthora cactorum]KAG3141975.1 hypothetical protein C6341_g19558 [Phytophthora cactorum]KAG4047114.1 hypothetical protein PC123_g17520 [Phytophthora cactorum]
MLEDREAERREDGADAVIRLTNFSPREANVLWVSVRGNIIRYWNAGRGCRSGFATKDVFSMRVVVAGSHFKIKTPTFTKTITGFLEVVAPKPYDA